MKTIKPFLLLLSTLLPFMTLFVSGLTFYLMNVNEINFDFRDIVLLLAVIFISSSGLIFLLLILIRNRKIVSGVFMGMLLGMALSMWIQSQVLIWKFGPFNGILIDWTQWKTNAIVDGILWLTIMILCIGFFLRNKMKIIRTLVTTLYLLGIVSIVLVFWKSPKSKATRIDASAYKEIFNFHPEKNVLIILLDDFQSDYFYKIAECYPEEVSGFDGFTFYRNTISRYPSTKVSLPSILSGELYYNDKIYDSYVGESYKKFNLFEAYRKKGYTTSFVGQLFALYPGIISMENLANKLHRDRMNFITQYIDYALFRGMPTLVKQFVYNKGNWMVSSLSRLNYPPQQHGGDIRFLELLEEKASVTSRTEGSFKFFHFYLPHAPWRVNENLKFDPALKGDSGYLRQTRGAVKLVSRIIKVLKEKGVYDQTEIVVMSDHGTTELGAIDSHNEYDHAVHNVSTFVQSSSLALLLHKPSGSKGRMTISDAPLELTDLACMLGFKQKDKDCSEFQNAIAGIDRPRKYYFYSWQQEYWGSDHLPAMTEYLVDGPAYSLDSYSLGGNIFTFEGVVKTNPDPVPFYTLGHAVRFYDNPDHESDRFVRTGWSGSESNFRWTTLPLAGLEFRLDRMPVKDLSLDFLALGYLGKNTVKYQVVTVVVNKVPVGRLLINEPKWYHAVIPQRLITTRNVNIVLKISNPMSPRQIENSNDDRKLGIAVTAIGMKEIW
jgi:hypothetical protein